MIDIKRIVFPTDFSDCATQAMSYVSEFAKKFGSKVTLVHIIPIPTYAGSYEISVDMGSMTAMMEESAQKQIEKVAVKLREDGLDVSTVIRLGTAFVEVIEVARELKADLIIIPTHGWGALKHLLLGSTAERIVRKAPCPVLTVRHPDHEFVHP